MTKFTILIGMLTWVVSLGSCNTSSSSKGETLAQSDSLRIDSTAFGANISGEMARLFVLKNKRGMEVYLTNFGARIVGLWVEDKHGNFRDVVLGFSSAQAYNNPKEPFFGTIVGPFANRIAKGHFKLDGISYRLPVNNGENTLHGGFKGLHFVNWNVQHQSDSSLTFSFVHRDGVEGFPGNVKIDVTYTMNENNELKIDYQAITDKKTVINLSNHAYFNLNGEGSGTILNHQLQLFSDHFTPVDKRLIPTGELVAVVGTPFDFNAPKAIGKSIDTVDEQLRFGKGYDHNFVLNKSSLGALDKAAQVMGDESGIVMDILTNEPGIQFYSGNFMNNQVTLKMGAKDGFRTGFCLEPQHFPDSPNQPSFPSTVLKPADTYRSTSIYRFSTTLK